MRPFGEDHLDKSFDEVVLGLAHPQAAADGSPCRYRLDGFVEGGTARLIPRQPSSTGKGSQAEGQVKLIRTWPSSHVVEGRPTTPPGVPSVRFLSSKERASARSSSRPPPARKAGDQSR